MEEREGWGWVYAMVDVDVVSVGGAYMLWYALHRRGHAGYVGRSSGDGEIVWMGDGGLEGRWK